MNKYTINFLYYEPQPYASCILLDNQTTQGTNGNNTYLLNLNASNEHDILKQTDSSKSSHNAGNFHTVNCGAHEDRDFWKPGHSHHNVLR